MIRDSCFRLPGENGAQALPEKEELVTSIEELQAANSELERRLESVSRSNSDLQNVLDATDIATLFLDAGLLIKRFTPQVSDLFDIEPGDQGRPITDFTHHLAYQELANDARGVLETLRPVEREIETRGNHWYLMRIRPYRTVEDEIAGVVVTFVDMTEQRRTTEALRVSEERLRQQLRLIEVSRTPFFVWDLDDGIVEWNRGAEVLYGYSRSEALGKTKEALLGTRVPGSSFAELRSKLLETGNWSGELEQTTKDGRTVNVDSQIELAATGGRRLVFESTWDITDRKSWEGRQHLLLRELSHRVKNTLAVVQAIVRLSKQRRLTLKEFVAGLDSRLNALGRAHELLIDSDWKGTEFGALARLQLKPYLSEGSERVRVTGEPVSLPLELATPLGLVLHELAVNSTKYGALSVNRGVVELSWKQKDGVLSVVWRERNGPPARTPRSRGFGSELIEKGIPNAKVKRDFRRDGLVCRIELPLDRAA